jgi:hypothetical protein
MASLALMTVAPLILSGVAKNILVSNLTTVADDALSILLRLREFSASTSHSDSSARPLTKDELFGKENTAFTEDPFDCTNNTTTTKQQEPEMNRWIITLCPDLYHRVVLLRTILLDVQSVVQVDKAIGPTSSSHTLNGQQQIEGESNTLASTNISGTITRNTLSIECSAAATTLPTNTTPCCQSFLLILQQMQRTLQLFYSAILRLQQKYEAHQHKWFSSYRTIDTEVELCVFKQCRRRLDEQMELFFKLLHLQSWYSSNKGSL